MDKTIEELKTEGKRLINLKRYPEAITLFKTLLKKAPNDTHTLDILGFLAYMTGDFEACKAYCDASIELKPDNYYALKGLGLCLVRLNRPEDGIATLKESIRINPNYFDSHYDLGVTYLELGRLDDAQTCFEASLKIDSRRKDMVDRALHVIERTRRKIGNKSPQ